jgi:hypothetical protein
MRIAQCRMVTLPQEQYLGGTARSVPIGWPDDDDPGDQCQQHYDYRRAQHLVLVPRDEEDYSPRRQGQQNAGDAEGDETSRWHYSVLQALATVSRKAVAGADRDAVAPGQVRRQQSEDAPRGGTVTGSMSPAGKLPWKVPRPSIQPTEH